MEGEGRRRERSLLFGDKADMMAIRKLEIIGNSHRAKPMRLGSDGESSHPCVLP